MNSAAQSFFNPLLDELHRHIVGQNLLLERLIIALLCDGHVLLEGVPGLAKTRTLSVLTACIDAKMNRVQFTPDLLPADLVGTEVYRPNSGDFQIRKGPIFTNLLLADEINRAPAKVQSALLQAMQEREVTIGEQTFQLPVPFLVLATQNPIEQEGTYSLPEAQLDRFLMKVKVTYPSFDEEKTILKVASVGRAEGLQVRKIFSIAHLRELRGAVEALHVDPKIDHYIISLVHASRAADAFGLKGMIEWGASPRAGIALRACARAHAFLKGREFVTPDDVKAVAPEVLRHRIIPSFDADARGINSDQIVDTLLKSVTVP